jgi:hypothetical protein
LLVGTARTGRRRVSCGQRQRGVGRGRLLGISVPGGLVRASLRTCESPAPVLPQASALVRLRTAGRSARCRAKSTVTLSPRTPAEVRAPIPWSEPPVCRAVQPLSTPAARRRPIGGGPLGSPHRAELGHGRSPIGGGSKGPASGRWAISIIGSPDDATAAPPTWYSPTRSPAIGAGTTDLFHESPPAKGAGDMLSPSRPPSDRSGNDVEGERHGRDRTS